MLIYESSFDQSRKIVEKHIPHLVAAGFIKEDADIFQLQNTLHPIVSNAMFIREKEVRDMERSQTFVKLARAITNDEDLANIVNILGYKITI